MRTPLVGTDAREWAVRRIDVEGVNSKEDSVNTSHPASRDTSPVNFGCGFLTRWPIILVEAYQGYCLRQVVPD